MIYKPEEVYKELQAGKFQAVYLLHGEEEYYIDLITQYIEQNALQGFEKDFNQIILYGKESQIGQLINASRRFPMMAQRQVVIVKEFQDLPELKSDQATSLLQKYIESPLPSTVLVLAHKHKTMDKRKALYKSLEKLACVMESKKLYDNELPRWIEGYFKRKNRQISPPASQLMAEHVGNDLTRLSKEIDKILLNLPHPEQVVTEGMVLELVGISREYNVFELQKALLEKNIVKANQIASFFAANPKDHPLIPILAILFQFFNKVLITHCLADKSEKNLAKELGVNPYFAKDYLKAIRYYSLEKVIDIIHNLAIADLHSKGINTAGKTEEAILKELIFRILH